ncbi:hypothetical protein DXC04_10955 [Dorea sp. OM07-5]|uniref:hypothetical protein n=1 Tax=Dorea sp. OM07-5 TaxID=2293100 RepID=UPI000E49E383|nr:hypothetical protein [Dorea sp. OM07-5]RHU94314.1 hypothetical protein DXC04_10955 [Dorea sp. OM07-5]
MKFKGLGKESAKMLWNKIKAELFNKSVTDVEVSGRTMTITKGDGSTSTQTTQDTTYGVVSKSASGLAPKLPDETTTTKYLRQDGTWAVPPDNNTTYSDATQENHGLMSAADKKKLDGVEEGANKYVHPTTSGNKHIPSGGSPGQILRRSEDGTAAWGADNDTTYDVFEGATGTHKGKEGLVPAPGNYNDASVLTSGGTWAMLGGNMFYDSDEVGSVLNLKVGDKSSGSITLERATDNQDGLMPRMMYSKLSTLPSATEMSNMYAKKSDITGVYRPKGSVADASKLPTSDQQSGDVWSIEADSAFGPAGTNVVWTSDGKWDNLGGIVTMEELTQADIDEICV